MSGRVFVDTNILVYAHDVSAGSKHDRAQAVVAELWHDHRGIISTQVLQELCFNLQRKTARPMPTGEVRRVLEDFIKWEVVVNTPQSVIEAFDIQVRHQVSFWDALILQAAEVSGAELLYSEDFSSGQSYGMIRVVNPLQP
jgi:predicted nucleic acid-binding protein